MSMPSQRRQGRGLHLRPRRPPQRRPARRQDGSARGSRSRAGLCLGHGGNRFRFSFRSSHNPIMLWSPPAFDGSTAPVTRQLPRWGSTTTSSTRLTCVAPLAVDPENACHLRGDPSQSPAPRRRAGRLAEVARRGTALSPWSLDNTFAPLICRPIEQAPSLVRTP